MIPILDVGAARSYLLNHPWQVASITAALIFLAIFTWYMGKRYPHRRKALRYTGLVLLIGAGSYSYWAYKAEEVSVGQKLHSLSEEATKNQSTQ